MAPPPPVILKKNDFSIFGGDWFYLWEAFQNINNLRRKGDFAVVDNFYLYQKILLLAAMGSGNVNTLGGTPNAVAKFTAPFNIGDSQRTDDGTDITDNAVRDILQITGRDLRQTIANDILQIVTGNKSMQVGNWIENVLLDKFETITGAKTETISGLVQQIVNNNSLERITGGFSKSFQTQGGGSWNRSVSGDISMGVIGRESRTIGGDRATSVGTDDSNLIGTFKVYQTGTFSTENIGTDKNENIGQDLFENVTRNDTKVVGGVSLETVSALGKTINVLGSFSENVTNKKQIIAGTFALAGATVQEFANNAAAIGGGLVAGDIYRTTVLGDAFLKIVI